MEVVVFPGDVVGEGLLVRSFRGVVGKDGSVQVRTICFSGNRVKFMQLNGPNRSLCLYHYFVTALTTKTF